MLEFFPELDTSFNPYEGLEVIATKDRANDSSDEHCFNPYEGLEVIATLPGGHGPTWLFSFNPYEGLEVIATSGKLGKSGYI